MLRNESPKTPEIRSLKKRTLSSPMIEVSSQASEDVTYAFPGYDSSLVGAKRPKQKLSRFQQVSTPKNKDMKRFFSSPVLPSVPQAAGNERRGFHKFQDELAKLKEAPEYSPHSSGDSSIYLKSRESQHDIEGNDNANCATDYMNQFYNESVDNDELIFCTQQAEIVLKAEIQQNTIVNPPNKPKSSNIPPIVEPKISTKPPASDPKPVINEIDVYFDDSFSDLLSNIDVIMEQAGSKTPVKSTVLPSKPNLPSTSTLSSASNFSKAILNSSNSTNSSNSGFPRHVSMPLKKIEAPAKTLCSKVNNMERHTSLNFNQQSTKSNNMKNYNSTESVQSSASSSTRTPPEQTRKCTPQEIEEKRQRALKIQESRRLERMRNLNQQKKK